MISELQIGDIMKLERKLKEVLQARATQYPVVTLTGPRQSGKTTLTKLAFPDFSYVSLEDPDNLEYARRDPREFLNQFTKGVILDEAQREPDLFSYIQGIVDANDQAGQFILTGSHNFLLLKSIKQSLAGRAAILHLLPLSNSEINQRKPSDLTNLGVNKPDPVNFNGPDLLDAMFTGGYPRIHDKGIPPQIWLTDYYRTYLERDVLDVLAIQDMEAFGRFIRLCAGRNGQLLNLSSLAADCGITHTTARSWISILEGSFVLKLLRPHYKNYSKRMIKSPKLYFLDSGLLCYLLQIRTSEELRNHSSRGAIFETFVLSELMKIFTNQGLTPDIWFWRDAKGHEVDLIVETENGIIPIEIKSGRTVVKDFFKGLNYYRKTAKNEDGHAALIYGGNETRVQQGTVVLPWWAL